MTVATYNAVLSACSRAGEVGTAKSLLSKMKRRGIKPNIISYNCIMSACAGTPRWKDAFLLLDQCHREPGVQPDIITFTNAMRACSRGGKTSQALTLLQVVKDKKLPIDDYCYTAVIDGTFSTCKRCCCFGHVAIFLTQLPFQLFAEQLVQRAKCGRKHWNSLMKCNRMELLQTKLRIGEFQQT